VNECSGVEHHHYFNIIGPLNDTGITNECKCPTQCSGVGGNPGNELLSLGFNIIKSLATLVVHCPLSNVVGMVGTVE